VPPRRLLGRRSRGGPGRPDLFFETLTSVLSSSSPRSPPFRGHSLADRHRAVLSSHRDDDASALEAVRLATRRARPPPPEQDVLAEPPVTLRDAMAAASGRDPRPSVR